MTDPTPLPIVNPDLSKPTLDAAVGEITTAAAPFIPAKIRATIYAIGGLVIVAAGAAAPVIGGTVGGVLDGISAAVGAFTAALAVSHVTK